MSDSNASIAIPIRDHTTIESAPSGTVRFFFGLDKQLRSVDDSGNIKLYAAGVVDSVNGQTGAVVLTADNIEIKKVTGATYSSVQQAFRMFMSAGVIDGGGDITSNGDGSVTISSGTVSIREASNPNSELYFANFTGGVFTPALNTPTYYYVAWNSGVPTITSSGTKPIDQHSNVLLGRCYREGTFVHISNGLKNLVSDSTKNITERFLDLGFMEHSSGGVTSEAGARGLSITAGLWWIGLTKVTTLARNTTTGDFFIQYYYNGTSWVESVGTQLDNTNYNNISTGLSPLGTNKYGVHWIYLQNDSDIITVYGQATYSTLADAVNASAPSLLPPEITEHGRLVSKAIVLNAATNLTQIQLFLTASPASSGGVSDHNTLLNLQTAGPGSTYGHITDQAQTIAGQKQFSSNMGLNIVPTSRFHLNGSFATSIFNINSDHTAADESTIFSDDTLSNITVTLPDPSTCVGREYVIKTIGTGTTFRTAIQSNGPALVEFVSLFEMYSGSKSAVRLKSNGVNWYLI